MPYKIVQTTEKGVKKLFIVPSNWEYQGNLRYPKKPIEYKLAKNENSKPRTDWAVMSCKVKRTGFPTYEDADEELSLMLQMSDTDVGGREENLAATIYATTDNDNTDFNHLADQYILQSRNERPLSSSGVTTQEPNEGSYIIMNNLDNIVTTPITQNVSDMITDKLNTVLENQKNMIEIQKRFAQRLGNFVLEMETKVEQTITRVLNRHLNQNITSLAEASTIETTSFKLKPINSIEELEEFELLLSDPIEKRKLEKLYSILCTTSDGHGITCTYKLIDVLFTREFLCKCSWSGGSRGDKIKIALKGYKNVLDFCFRMVLSWDKSFTIDENEIFFKLVLRNAEQRKNIKNLRKPAMRKRARKNERKNENKQAMEKATNNGATEVEEEQTEPNEDIEKDEQKRLKKDVFDELVKYILVETDIDTEESVVELEEEKEEVPEEEMEENLECEKEGNLEEEKEGNLEEEKEGNLEEENEQDVEIEHEQVLEEEKEADLEKKKDEALNDNKEKTEKRVKENVNKKKDSAIQKLETQNIEKFSKQFENFRVVKNVKTGYYEDSGIRVGKMKKSINEKDLLHHTPPKKYKQAIKK